MTHFATEHAEAAEALRPYLAGMALVGNVCRPRADRAVGEGAPAVGHRSVVAEARLTRHRHEAGIVAKQAATAESRSAVGLIYSRQRAGGYLCSYRLERRPRTAMLPSANKTRVVGSGMIS